ncbi:MAG: hypothetical protein RL236_1705 [Pseudomonadota bacterium]|jgi:hypothetical protein
MTDEELKELVASLAIKSDRLDAQLSRTDEQIVELLSAQKESARKLDKVGDLLGNIARNQGDVAEEFFFNSLASDTHLGSVHFDDITKNQHKQRGKFQEE